MLGIFYLYIKYVCCYRLYYWVLEEQSQFLLSTVVCTSFPTSFCLLTSPMFLASSWVRACSIDLTLFTVVVSNYRLVSTDDRIPFFYGKTTFCYIHTISFLIQKQYIFDFYILDIVTIAKINLRLQVFLWHSNLTAEHVWLFCVSWGTIDCFL